MCLVKGENEREMDQVKDLWHHRALKKNINKQIKLRINKESEIESAVYCTIAFIRLRHWPSRRGDKKAVWKYLRKTLHCPLIH